MYEQLPHIMMIHWDFLGEPNGFMDKLTGAWMIPLLMMILWALWEVLPASDQRHCQSDSFLEPYWQFGNMMLILMAALQWGIVQANLSADFPLLRFTGWILVVLIAWMGRVLPLLPRNYVMGIRTPWSLGSSRVWRLTHIETAKGLRTVALLSIIFQVALPPPWNLVLILVSFLGCLLSGTLLSYIYRRY
jgi:uncharacterized membrane protein